MDKKVLKQKLSDILIGETISYNIEELIEKMMAHIGDVDPVLRDELISTVFSHIILDHKMSIDQVNKVLLHILSSDFLFYNIGDTYEDSVFRRSFSALVFADIIKKHALSNILDKDTVNLAVVKATKYLILEKDERGIIPIKGWAHATAHGADVLRNLMELKDLTSTHINMILQSIVDKLNLLTCPFGANEDERLSMVYFKLIEQGVHNDLMHVYLSKMIDQIQKKEYLKLQNTKYFLRALKDRITQHNQSHAMIGHIETLIKSIVV